MRILVPALILSAGLALTTGALAADTKTSTPAPKTTAAAPATPATPAKAAPKAAPKQVTGTKEECEKAYAAETHHKKSKANFMKACVKPTPKT